MEDKLIEIAASQGIWTTLSFFLIIYILKNQEKRDLRQEEREKNYQIVISNLSEKLEVIKELKLDMEDIKKYIYIK